MSKLSKSYDPKKIASEVGYPLKSRRLLEPHYELICILRGRGWTFSGISQVLEQKVGLKVHSQTVSNFCYHRKIPSAKTLNDIKEKENVKAVKKKMKEAAAK